MHMISPIHRMFTTLLALMLLTGCATSGSAYTSTNATDNFITADAEVSSESGAFSDAAHSKETEPDYALVFPQDAVNRIDITLPEESWSALQAEMTEQFGDFGEGERRQGQAPGANNQPLPDNAQPPANAQAPQNPPGEIPTPGENPPNAGNRPGGGGGMDMGDTSYAKSTVTFNGETWQDVGFRYSGNSTLQTSWQNGTLKISFRLDFDEFEDENPATEDQRFYGFKQISFKSNAMDDSYLREKVTADIFREAGVTASQTAYYEVYIDYGEGPQYFGVYTAVEIVDDTVIETQFADDSGNVYKPEGNGANFAAGAFSETTFEKQTNEDEADWSDIQAVFDALHSDLRTSDPAAWREGLEAVFNVDAFLRWLAVDTIIQNWDTYGNMAHNYYLYTDPEDGLVTWIPWDNNMALSSSGDRAEGVNDKGQRGARELDITTVSEQWPLISYLAVDEVYLAKYRQYLQETLDTVWQPEELVAKYQYYHDLIAPYVEKEEEGFTQLSSMSAFDEALELLKAHAQERFNVVMEYLAK
jgi:spore coat protein H